MYNSGVVPICRYWAELFLTRHYGISGGNNKCIFSKVCNLSVYIKILVVSVGLTFGPLLGLTFGPILEFVFTSTISKMAQKLTQLFNQKKLSNQLS